jgi:hypothetical protein
VRVIFFDLEITLIPTLLPQEKGFNFILFNSGSIITYALGNGMNA